MHDFTSKSIKLRLLDPAAGSKNPSVLLSLAHLVRLVPEYYQDGDGKRMVTQQTDDDPAQRQGGIKRSFIIHDDIGGRYESHSASREAQALLEQIWAESA